MDKLSIIFNKTLIFRIIISIALVVLSSVQFFTGNIKILMLILSAFLSGFDILLDAVYRMQERDYLSESLVVIFSVLSLFLLDYSIEAISVIIIYHLGKMLVNYLNDRAGNKALNLIDRKNMDTVSRMCDVFDEDDSVVLHSELVLSKTLFPVFLISAVIALLYAILMPFIKHLSFHSSIHRALAIFIISNPFSMLCCNTAIARYSLCEAAANGLIFKKANDLEKVYHSKTVKIDSDLMKGKYRPELIYSHSGRMSQDAFLNFVYHAVYMSSQKFADILRDSISCKYQSGIISDFIDIPGYGVKASVNGMELLFANRQLAEKFKIDVSMEDNPEIRGYFYYLCLGGQCVGTVVLSEDSSGKFDEIIDYLDETGFSCELTENADNSKTDILICKTKNAALYPSKIKIVCDYENSGYDANIYPDSIDNITILPFLSRRVNEYPVYAAFSVFIIKIILIVISILGFCTPWISLLVDTAAGCLSIYTADRVLKEKSIKSRIIQI